MEMGRQVGRQSGRQVDRYVCTLMVSVYSWRLSPCGLEKNWFLLVPVPFSYLRSHVSNANLEFGCFKPLVFSCQIMPSQSHLQCTPWLFHG